MSRARRQRENRELVTRLERDARRIALHFGLRYRAIEAERANVKARYGICYSDGTIRIRLRHASSGEPLKYSSLVNTLCHELAHLRHFNHGVRFRRFYARILAWAKRQGIYQPGGASARHGASPQLAPPRRPRAEPTPRAAGDRPAPAAALPAEPVRGPEQLTLFG